MAIKAVTFDLDGTLYSYSRLLSHSLLVAVRHPRFIIHFSRVRSKIRKIRPISDFRKIQARLLAERMAISYQKSYDLIESHIYRKLEDSFKGIKPFPFLKQTLSRLKDSGLKLAVLSDFPVKRKLQHLGLDGFWDCTFCSEDTGYLKPNPEPFLKLASLLHLSPREILYIGDKYYYDIVGAHRVGMRTGYLTRRPEANCVADFTFHSYKNFMNSLKKFNKC